MYTECLASTKLSTRSDFAFQVRHVVADDEPALAAFFRQVTPDDLRFRFLTAVKKSAMSDCWR